MHKAGRYQHNAQGQLSAIGLPSGHWLHPQRNGQGQVVAMTLSPVQRPWLRALAPEQLLASDLRRDLVGPSHLRAGNGITTDWQRSADASLARAVHRRPAPSSAGPTQTAAAQAHITQARWLARSTQEFIALLLGASSAWAQAAPLPSAHAAPAGRGQV